MVSRAKNAIVGLFFLLARLCVTVISTLNGSHSAVFRDNQKIPKRVPPWYPKLYFEPKKKGSKKFFSGVRILKKKQSLRISSRSTY